MSDKYAPVTLSAAALRRLYRAEARQALDTGQELYTAKPCETRDEIAAFAKAMRYRARFTEGVLYQINQRIGSFRRVLEAHDA